MDRAEELVDAEGLTLVPPYDHAWIIAGQGTAGLEIAADLPDVGHRARAGRWRRPQRGRRDRDQAPRAERARRRRRAGGRAEALAGARSGTSGAHSRRTRGLADGLLAVEVGRRSPSPTTSATSTTSCRWTTRRCRRDALLLDRMKLVAEPSGAITVAALLEGPSAARETVARAERRQHRVGGNSRSSWRQLK